MRIGRIRMMERHTGHFLNVSDVLTMRGGKVLNFLTQTSQTHLCPQFTNACEEFFSLQIQHRSDAPISVSICSNCGRWGAGSSWSCCCCWGELTVDWVVPAVLESASARPRPLPPPRPWPLPRPLPPPCPRPRPRPRPLVRASVRAILGDKLLIKKYKL